MNSKFFKLNWKDVLGAFVSSVLSAVLMYLANITDLATINGKTILFIVITVGASSLLKALTTDRSGNFAGVVPVK